MDYLESWGSSMNQTFKVIFNRARQGLMVANEITSSVQKKGVKTIVAIAAAAACGATFAQTGIADSVATFKINTTISTDVLSGETTQYGGRYSAIAATAEDASVEVTVLEGATLNIEGDLATMPDAERIYLISAQAGSKVSITGDVTGNIKTTDVRNIRGIRANGGEITIDGDLIATVNGGSVQTNGLDAWSGSQVTLKGDKTILSVTSSGTSGKGTYGLDIEEGSEVSFLATETEISVDNSKGNGTYSRGAYAYQSTTTFTGNTTIKVLGNNALTEGIHFECDPGNSYETNVSFSGEETTIDVSGKGESYTIYASGVPGTISFTGKTATIKSHSSEGIACGVLSQYGAHANFTADTSVTVSTESSGYARGIWIANYGGKDAYVAGNAEFKNLTVTVDAKNADAYGIYNEASKVKAPKSGETDGAFTAESTTLSVSAAKQACGIYADGDLAKVTLGTLEKFDVSTTSAEAYGVVSRNGANVVLGTEGTASVINVTSTDSEIASVGVYVGDGGKVTLNGATKITADLALYGDGELTINGDLVFDGTVSDFTGNATINAGTTTLTESTGYLGKAKVIVSGGTLAAKTIALEETGSLKLDGGTLQTSVGQVFTDASLETTDFSENKKEGITLSSGTLALTDTGTYKATFAEKLAEALGNVSLRLTEATLDASEKATLLNNVIQESANVEIAVSESETAVTIGTNSSGSATTTGAATISLSEKADTTVAEASNVTLVGKTDGSAFIENATALTVADNATLNLGSVNTSEATTGTLPEVTLSEKATLNVTNATVTTPELTGGSDAQINLGTSEAAGSLHTEKLSLNGAAVFLDPAWQDSTTIDDASSMSAVVVDNLTGAIVAGQNSIVVLGAAKTDAVTGFNKLAQENSDLTWGASGITAALYLGQSIDVSSAKITVNGSFTERPTSVLDGVNIASQGLLMIDQTAIGNSVVITGGTLTLASGSYIGLVNATSGSLTLTTEASNTTGSATVLTDNPFITATLSDNVITATSTADGGLKAIASTGIQAMTRRADSILAQTIADRTALDQELAPGANLWVDVTGESYEADKLDNGASFKADMGYGAFGVEFGGDAASAGAAIQYGKGTLRSSVSSIKNRIDSYGATIYGAMKFGDSKVVADIAYVKNENEITSSQAALNKKPDAQIYSIGVRGQHRFNAGNFQIVPSVGVRVSRLETDAMNIGSVDVAKQKQTLVQVPVVLRISGATQSAAGWVLSPSFKLAYIPTFGDKEITALGADQTVIDTSPVQADFGIRAQKGNLMLNANFMAGTGNDGASSIGGKVGLKYVF